MREYREFTARNGSENAIVRVNSGVLESGGRAKLRKFARTAASVNAEQDAKDPKMLPDARTGPGMNAERAKPATIRPYERIMVRVN